MQITAVEQLSGSKYLFYFADGKQRIVQEEDEFHVEVTEMERHEEKIGVFVNRGICEEIYVESVNPNHGNVELRQVTGGIKHERENKIVDVEFIDGRAIRVTEDHSLFVTKDDNGLSVRKPKDADMFSVVDNNKTRNLAVASVKVAKNQSRFVYDISVECNQNFLASSGVLCHNSAFSNLSIFDHVFLKSLFDDYRYPDGSAPDLDSVYELQKRFAEYFASIMGKEGIFTFPVVTLAIAREEGNGAMDQEFLDWACSVNAEKCMYSLYVGEPTSIASCLSGKEEIFYEVEDV